MTKRERERECACHIQRKQRRDDNVQLKQCEKVRLAGLAWRVMGKTVAACRAVEPPHNLSKGKVHNKSNVT